MGCYPKNTHLTTIILTLSVTLRLSHSTTIKDIFSPDAALTRIPRDIGSGTYSNRYTSSNSDDKTLKPEDAPEARDNPSSTPLEKRCISCETGYYSRYPSYDRYRNDDYRRRDYDRYEDRDRYLDRDRYDRYSDRPVGYRDRYDRFSDRYGDRYDRYEDRYDPYDRSDRYDRYDRYQDRGLGYDNRGYDYRDYDRDSYRPWDETYRGTSGFDGAGRGYYFASGRPDYGSSSGYGRYANRYYGSSSSSGRDDYSRDRGYGGSYRPYRDYEGYRTTSYLYGRPSTTTGKPPSDDDNGNTPSPQENSG